MSLHKAFKTDETKEVEGVPVEYPGARNEDGTVPRFYLSRAGKLNKKYQKMLDLKTKPFTRQLQLGTLDNETSDKIYMEVFCKTVLKGWENVQDENGQEIPYSVETATALFTELADLYDDLFDKARSAAMFRETENEEDAKN